MHLPFNAAPLRQPGPEDFLAEANRVMYEKTRHAALMWDQEDFGEILGAPVAGERHQHVMVALYNPGFDRYDLRLLYADTGKTAYRATVNAKGGLVTNEKRAEAPMCGNDYMTAIDLLIATKFSKPYTSVVAGIISKQTAGVAWGFLPKDSLGVATRKVVREYSGKLVDELMLGMRSMWRLPPDVWQ